jgi:hypothetical protein
MLSHITHQHIHTQGSRRSSSIDGKSPLDDQRLIRSSFQMGSDWVGSVEVNNNAQRRSKFSQRKGGPSKGMYGDR